MHNSILPTKAAISDCFEIYQGAQISDMWIWPWYTWIEKNQGSVWLFGKCENDEICPKRAISGFWGKPKPSKIKIHEKVHMVYPAVKKEGNWSLSSWHHQTRGSKSWKSTTNTASKEENWETQTSDKKEEQIQWVYEQPR